MPLSTAQRHDSTWRQWSRNARRHRRKYARSSLIFDTYVDPKIHDFMQITTMGVGPSTSFPRMGRNGKIHQRREGSGYKNNKKKTMVGYGADEATTAMMMLAIRSAPNGSAILPSPHQKTAPGNNKSINTESPQRQGESSWMGEQVGLLPHTTTPSATGPREEEINRMVPVAATESTNVAISPASDLMRVTTSMVLDVQQCIMSQIQLERQEHHLPLRPRRTGAGDKLIASRGGEPTGSAAEETSCGSGSKHSGQDEDVTMPQATTTNGAGMMSTTCLICPASVQVPTVSPSSARDDDVLVYCTNCTTLASASLLRKLAQEKQAQPLGGTVAACHGIPTKRMTPPPSSKVSRHPPISSSAVP